MEGVAQGIAGAARGRGTYHLPGSCIMAIAHRIVSAVCESEDLQEYPRNITSSSRNGNLPTRKRRQATALMTPADGQARALHPLLLLPA
ncbi:hypothetical protein MauCBS54593_007072 [Microsporum audouinii]